MNGMNLDKFFADVITYKDVDNGMFNMDDYLMIHLIQELCEVREITYHFDMILDVYKNENDMSIHIQPSLLVKLIDEISDVINLARLLQSLYTNTSKPKYNGQVVQDYGIQMTALIIRMTNIIRRREQFAMSLCYTIYDTMYELLRMYQRLFKTSDPRRIVKMVELYGILKMLARRERYGSKFKPDFTYESVYRLFIKSLTHVGYDKLRAPIMLEIASLHWRFDNV